ncbi:MAG TPA: hypothetical protein DC013_11395 [Ruminococcaceae bacterium]|jgi:hypothetical protein|nr:hypothetical protein [Oscillospiraceae bacterium]
MILSLLIVTWLMFGVAAASVLFDRHHRNGRILGVTLSRDHAESSPEVKEILRGFTRASWAVPLIFFALSLLALTKGMRPYAEFYLLILMLADFFAAWFSFHRCQEKLRAVKEKNAWTERRANVVTVDLNVSKEKGKSGVSATWVRLFFVLSFLPTVFLILSPKAREIYPIGFSLIGPFCQLCMVFLYRQMKNLHAPALSSRTEVNQACAKAEERINTKSASLSGFFMLIFWILFNAVMIYGRDPFLTVLPTVILIVSLLWIAYWQQREIRLAEDRFFGELPESEEGAEPENVWKWGFYCNPNDPRIFVPKRIPSMGFTINIGRRPGKAAGISILALTLILIAAVLGLVLYGGSKDYVVTENGSGLAIDAGMYDMTVEKGRVESVSTIDALPNGTRTNGYGGANKSFGHFSLDGYGKCMLYVYNDVGRYIVLKLRGDDPAYVIVNGKSPEETQRLYQEIGQWLKQ